MTPIKATIADFWLEYRNDFLTVERFAEYHEMSVADATRSPIPEYTAKKI